MLYLHEEKKKAGKISQETATNWFIPVKESP